LNEGWVVRAEALEGEGRFFEASRAWEWAGAPARALDCLVRLRVDDPRYREGCRRAVDLLQAGLPLSLAVENLLGGFVRSGPRSAAEADTFDRLSRIYERSGFPQNAAEALGKLIDFRPGDAEAGARLQALSGAAVMELPELPELGPPPELPKEPDTEDEIVDYTKLEEDGGPPFRTGVTIAGRFLLEDRIGTGGMSVVFRAQDLEIGEVVAIKVFTQGIFDKESDERLRRELRLSRRLIHPNVVRLYDTGVAHGFRFITLELLTGMDLRHRMRGRPLPVAEGLSYLLEACAGLQAAHDLGIVHRDVKPENFYLVRGGGLKVMDFGIAKLENAPGITATGIIAGTPAYMAPEQAMDFRNVNFRADIYSMGVVAFEIFTGMLPFNHPESMQILMMHAQEPAPSLRERNPALPPALEETVLRCLEKIPARRFESCRELAERLDAAIGRLPHAGR
jgi:eukaryotic-like serine/threonine-protein kinase